MLQLCALLSVQLGTGNPELFTSLKPLLFQLALDESLSPQERAAVCVCACVRACVCVCVRACVCMHVSVCTRGCGLEHACTCMHRAISPKSRGEA